MSSSKQIVAGHAWSLTEFPECREYQHKFDSELLPKINAFKRKADKLKHISYSVWLEGCECDTDKFTEWGYVNGIPINELNIQCDWKIKGVSDKEFRKQLISDVEKMLHQASDPRHKYFREEGLGCTYEDWYSKLKKVNDYITQKVGDSTMRKFNYNGRVITAETKEEAIRVFAENKRLNLPKNWKWNPTGGVDGGLLYYSKYTGNRLIDNFLLDETGIELENEKEMKEFVKSNKKDFDEFNKLIDKLSSNYILMSLEKDGVY